jgi:hypothetical protein
LLEDTLVHWWHQGLPLYTNPSCGSICNLWNIA